jgi:hypothetical protein
VRAERGVAVASKPCSVCEVGVTKSRIPKRPKASAWGRQRAALQERAEKRGDGWFGREMTAGKTSPAVAVVRWRHCIRGLGRTFPLEGPKKDISKVYRRALEENNDRTTCAARRHGVIRRFPVGATVAQWISATLRKGFCIMHELVPLGRTDIFLKFRLRPLWQKLWVEQGRGRRKGQSPWGLLRTTQASRCRTPPVRSCSSRLRDGSLLAAKCNGRR